MKKKCYNQLTNFLNTFPLQIKPVKSVKGSLHMFIFAPSAALMG